MDTKITKKRLNDHLSYDWWKYLAILTASIFFWSLVFTMSSPRLAVSKKLEIFYIANGYNSENTNEIINRLKGNISEEIIEINFYNYFPDDSTTSQVLSTRIAVKEGDLYAFEYTTDPENNNSLGGSFVGYVDYGLLADFESLITAAKEFGNPDNIKTYEKFKSENTNKKLNTEEKLLNEYNIYVTRLTRAKQQAEKLEGYIASYPQLFISYAKYTVAISEQEDGGNYTIEETKHWGIDFNGFKIDNKNYVNDLETIGFIQDTRGIDIVTGQSYPLQLAMGIVSFKEDNMPLYYENLAVINFFIEQYYINNMPE